MVELPITLPQDHTIFFILQHSGPDIWLEKARFLRDRQGMALLLTHPDYAHDRRVADGYRTLLEEFQHDDTAWRTVPREVAAWWRDRDASTIGRAGDAWRVEGPAAGRARLCLAYPGTSAPAGLRRDGDEGLGPVLARRSSVSRRARLVTFRKRAPGARSLH